MNNKAFKALQVGQVVRHRDYGKCSVTEAVEGFGVKLRPMTDAGLMHLAVHASLSKSMDYLCASAREVETLGPEIIDEPAMSNAVELFMEGDGEYKPGEFGGRPAIASERGIVVFSLEESGPAICACKRGGTFQQFPSIKEAMAYLGNDHDPKQS